MKTKTALLNTKDLIIFRDLNDEDAYYAMTPEVLIEKIKITEEYGGKESKVPDEFKIKVHPFVRTENNKLQFLAKEPDFKTLIEFPINSIFWEWIPQIT